MPPAINLAISGSENRNIATQAPDLKDEATGRMIRWSDSTYAGSTATKVEYQSTGGNWQSVYVVWGTTTVQGILYFHTDWNLFGGPTHTGGTCSDWAYVGDELPVVRSIVLPATETGIDPQQFSFAYNSDSSSSVTDTSISIGCGTAGTVTRDASAGLGEISQVTMPSGALVNYHYWHDTVHKILGSVNISGDTAVNDVLTSKVVTHDGTPSQPETDTWTYEIPPYNGAVKATVTNPDGSTTVETSFPTDPLRASLAGTSGLNGLTYRATDKGQVGTTDKGRIMTERHWTLLGGTLYSFGSFPSGSNNKISYNPVVDTEYTTLLDTDGVTRLKMTAKSFTYDYNGELTSTTEYDWINLGSVSYDSVTGVPTGIPSGTAVLRVTNNSFYNTASSSASSTAYGTRALGSGSTVILGKLKETTVGTSSTTKSDTRFSYDGNSWGTAPSTGNLTTTSAYNDTSSSWINTTATYDSHGNVTATTDGNGNTTAITYGSVGGYSSLYPTQVVQAYGTSVARTMQTGYDFYTGLPISVKDVDNDVTTATDYDVLGRPVLVTNAQGKSGFENHVKTEYYDHDRYVVTKADLTTMDDGAKVAAKYFDQMGRVHLTRTLEDASTQYPEDPCDGSISSHGCMGIKVETDYKSDPSGYSYVLTSNPFRAATATAATGEETMGWTLSKQWATGRESQVQTFSGAAMPSPFGSNSSSTGIVDTQIVADATQVTDQAGKVRRSITGPLGTLIRVDEPTSSGLGTVASPNQYTSYTYDVLNDLIGVSQGSQSRSFSYNSLARLTSATNPESGTIAYGYDSNGNLTSKTDARNITTSYTYDALNRIAQRSYSNDPTSTPTVTYTYDNKTNAYGKLTKVSSSVSTTEYTSFDILGRVTGHKQTTASTDYTTSYTYNLAGELLTETYPSGRMVSNTFASNGDLSQVQTKPSGGSYANRASNFVYNPAGAVQSLELGNGKYETTHFNSRLQPTQIGLGTSTSDTSLLKLEYSYGTTANNGNVLSQTITVPGVTYPFPQTYTYDELNRLASAAETYNGSQNWKQEFSYDRYGNRSFVTGTGHTDTLGGCTTMCNPTFSNTTNRITSSGYTFDSDGNVTADPSGRSFVYDGENKQTSVSNGSTIGTYYFDGDGKRVKKTSGSDSVIFVYDAAGVMLEEYPTSALTTVSTSYVYAGQGLLSTETSSATEYTTSDHLGSPRLVSSVSGSVVSRHDYMPFGEEIASAQRTSAVGYGGTDGIRKQFTGDERDAETGLDFAQARYLNSSYGRFTTPDPLLSSGTITNPQSWNRFAYVLNNPEVYIDPLGLYEWSAELGGSTGDDDLESAYGKDKAKKIRKQRDLFRNGLKAASEAGAKSDDPSEVARATGSYGCEAIAAGCTNGSNGVVVTFGTTTNGAAAEVKADGASLDINEDGSVRARILVTVSDTLTDSSANSLAEYIGHEGSHNADRQAFASYLQNQIKAAGGYSKFFADAELSQRAFNNLGYNKTVYSTEVRAYEVSGLVAQGRDAITHSVANSSYGGNEVWNRSWSAADRSYLRSLGADNHVTTSPRYMNRLNETMFPR